MIQFEVDGVPQTKGSWKPGRGRNGRIVLRPDNEGEPAWAEAVAWAAKQARARSVLGKVEPSKERRWAVELQFVLPAPPNGRRTNRRDVDKLARSVLDALTGIIWADDEQVDHLVVDKWIVGTVVTRERPGLVAFITQLGA